MLIQNIIDQIKEVQMKLGFAKETMRLYYPVETVCRLLGMECQDPKILMDRLETLNDEKSPMGILGFKLHKGRIEVRVTEEGVVYVHEHFPEPEFLKRIITLFSENHHCHMADVRNLFDAFGEAYHEEKMPENSDFDAVFYFLDPQVDGYYYCIKEEMGHTIYHRFTKYDMENFMNI